MSSLQVHARELPPSRLASRLRRAIIWLAGLGALCALYGYFVEPRWPAVNRLRLVSLKVDPGKDFRLVQISDLHSGARTGLEERLPDIIAAEQPDLIVFTGDLLNDVDGLPKARRLFTQLSTIAPVFAIPGNADDRFFGNSNPYAGLNVHYLQNEVATTSVGHSAIRLLGTVTEHSVAIKLLEKLPEDGFTVLLHHCPQLLPVAATSRVDLFLSGHTHGGQAALPMFGAVAGVGGTAGLHAPGLYRQGDMYAHVNVGLGMSKVFPIRFLVRPEITVIEVVPAE